MAANPEPHPEPDSEPGRRSAATVRRATTRLQRRLRAEGAPGGLSTGKLSALGHLFRGPPMTPGELAAADSLQPQSMTRALLADLERDGLVTRAPDPGDARRVRIAITDAGEAVLTADARQRDAWLARAMTLELSPVERSVLVLAADLMDRLADLPAPVPSGAVSPVPAEARAVPILPSHDPPATAAFFERLGFFTNRGSDADYVMVERDGIELHYTRVPDVDPFRTAGVAYVSVPDADALHAEIVAAGVPAWAVPGGAAALRRRWATTHDLSRVGPPEDKPWRVREFALADPTNNLLRVGQPIGLNRRRVERGAGRSAGLAREGANQAAAPKGRQES